jgi:hypothetical protein
MILALAVLVPVLFLSLWLFFKLSPKDADKTRVCLYNAGVLVVCVMICGALTFKLHSTLADTMDRAWWPILSALGSLVASSLCLAMGGVVRNLVLFR